MYDGLYKNSFFIFHQSDFHTNASSPPRNASFGLDEPIADLPRILCYSTLSDKKLKLDDASSSGVGGQAANGTGVGGDLCHVVSTPTRVSQDTAKCLEGLDKSYVRPKK